MNKNFVINNKEIDEYFSIDIDGYEGPLHLLLELSKKHKIDLKKIAILELADQYLDYISDKKKLKIEVAADYLLMASWLAFLKSKLFLPIEEFDDENAEYLAELLSIRLKNLEKIRVFSEKISFFDSLNRDFFGRGEQEKFSEKVKIKYTANLIDILNAFAKVNQSEVKKPLKINLEKHFKIDDILEKIKKIIVKNNDWFDFNDFVCDLIDEENKNYKSALSCSFVASLELARSGLLDINQDTNFSEIYIKGKYNE